MGGHGDVLRPHGDQRVDHRLPNGVSRHARPIEGAVFAGCPYDPTHTSGMSMSDIVLKDSCAIAYNQAVVGAVSTSSLRTTTVVTRTVAGSWQQLPAR